MTSRGPRERIAVGVYQDKVGFEVRALARGKSRCKRFPKGTRLSVMKGWQDTQRKSIREATRIARATAREGTLAGDVAAHLGTMTIAQRRAAVALYNAWLTPSLASRARAGVTLEQLRTVVSGWLEAGVAASTVNHRRRALIALYEALDGEDPPVLPRRLKRQREPAPVPRGHDMAQLDAIISGMRDYPYHGRARRLSKPKARLRLMLWTGITPSTMRRLTAHSINLDAKEIALPARGKGRGSPAVTLPLWEPEGVEAARAWLRANAWGKARTERLADALQRAIRAYRERCPAVTLPPQIRLHDLRHSFLTMIALTRRDPRLVQWYGQHADLATSQRYILAAMPELAREAARVPRARATETA